jgi:FKBP-type peptidyl-prolyl cis-trans isomerase SlyD
MSLPIGDDTVVSIHYKLTDTEGAVIDSSEGTNPLKYLHGAGNIIPGLETALIGKSQGDSLQVVVSPEQGYGEHQPDLVQVVPRSAFQGVDDVEAGMAFNAEGADGSQRRIVVREVEGDDVTVDGNHELAGIDLHFSVDVVEVREATEEEKSHGHAH